VKRKYILWLHVACWFLLLATNQWQSLLANVFSDDKNQAVDVSQFFRHLVIQITYLLVPLSCFYSGYLLVAPQITKRKYIKIALFTILVLVFVSGLRYAFEYYFFMPVFGFDNYKGHPWPLNRFVTNIFFYYFPTYFIYGILYFFVEGWYKTKQQQQELLKEKATAELTFLRSQVNPHYLFNTINDIYSLTCQQSNQAPVALLKLSEILRYMLREGNEDTMLLQSEITYLGNVIELQRISAKGNAFINFTVEGYIGRQKIATLIFIAFVENAFKHGVLTDSENPVLIGFVATPDNVEFAVRNKKNFAQKDKTPGIGLNNVRRRLELIYPGKHLLSINDSDEFYTVSLTLQLV